MRNPAITQWVARKLWEIGASPQIVSIIDQRNQTIDELVGARRELAAQKKLAQSRLRLTKRDTEGLSEDEVNQLKDDLARQRESAVRDYEETVDALEGELAELSKLQKEAGKYYPWYQRRNPMNNPLAWSGAEEISPIDQNRDEKQFVQLWNLGWGSDDSNISGIGIATNGTYHIETGDGGNLYKFSKSKFNNVLKRMKQDSGMYGRNPMAWESTSEITQLTGTSIPTEGKDRQTGPPPTPERPSRFKPYSKSRSLPGSRSFRASYVNPASYEEMNMPGSSGSDYIEPMVVPEMDATWYYDRGNMRSPIYNPLSAGAERWRKFLMQYHRAHPGNSFKRSMKEAARVYKRQNPDSSSYEFEAQVGTKLGIGLPGVVVGALAVLGALWFVQRKQDLSLSGVPGSGLFFNK